MKFKGKDVHSLSKDELRKHRPNMQLVFQDPFSSLNPRMRIGEALGEPMLAHGLATKENVREKVIEVLELCGLAPYHIDRYPHEFSGGQRQRIVIARAMVLNPEFIVADEPVAALDVSIQAQIINLFSELQEKKGLSYLFISHDLSVVEHLCTKIGIMYLGTIVETAPRDELFTNPLHPYTKALLSAVPIPDPTVKRERIILEGIFQVQQIHLQVVVFIHVARLQQMFVKTIPEFRNVGDDHFVSCHHVKRTLSNGKSPFYLLDEVCFNTNCSIA